MKILHLEDNRNDAELVEQSLKTEWPECEIENVDRREDYLARLDQGCDLILSDFSLHNFNGLDALRIAREKVPNKPFIFLSGTIGEERALDALRAGASDYVLKDRPKRLIPAVRRAMADIEEKRKRDETNEQLVRVQRLENLGMLAAGIAHDFNNVLTPILLGVTLLRRAQQTPAEMRILNNMETSATRGSELVKQILGFTQATTGEPQFVQPKHVLRELHQLIEQTFAKNIELNDDIDSDLWPLKINPTQLFQILLNLCVNARDAMPAGGTLTLRAKNQQLSFSPEKTPAPHLVLEIEDTGTGIVPSILERIWEPFFTTKKEGSGTGLGLAIVKGLVEENAGAISVHSIPGYGTTFSIKLPASPGSESPVSTEEFSITRANGELVLVAADDAMVRESIGTLLNLRGYQVILAADGAEALALFAPRHLEIKAVITDCDMPHLDGRSLISVVRRLNPVIPIIMVSGRNQENHRALDPHLKLLTKPFAGRRLLEMLHEMLNV